MEHHNVWKKKVIMKSERELETGEYGKGALWIDLTKHGLVWRKRDREEKQGLWNERTRR